MNNSIANLLYLSLALVSLCLDVFTGKDLGLYTMSFLILSAIHGTAKDK